jgi:hypothetical protein
VNLPKIAKPLTATELRDRVLAAMNGESVQLSAVDQERRRRLAHSLRTAKKGQPR